MISHPQIKKLSPIKEAVWKETFRSHENQIVFLELLHE